MSEPTLTSDLRLVEAALRSARAFGLRHRRGGLADFYALQTDALAALERLKRDAREDQMALPLFRKEASDETTGQHDH